MQLSTTLVLIGSLMLLGTFLLTDQPSFPSLPALPMTHPSTATCHRNPVQASLRLWLDPIPQTPAGLAALPPGITPPPPQPRGPETHALNLELTLLNASTDSQSARIVGWSWSQGRQTHPQPWHGQPDLSPLNRDNWIERHLVQLQGNQPVKATVDLEINGQPCPMQVQLRP